MFSADLKIGRRLVFTALQARHFDIALIDRNPTVALPFEVESDYKILMQVPLSRVKAITILVKNQVQAAQPFSVTVKGVSREVPTVLLDHSFMRMTRDVVPIQLFNCALAFNRDGDRGEPEKFLPVAEVPPFTGKMYKTTTSEGNPYGNV